MSDLNDLAAEIHEINEANGWHENIPDPSDAAAFTHWAITQFALVMTEASEAIEEIRNGHALDEVYHSQPPVPPSLAVDFPSGADARAHWAEHGPKKEEGVPSEVADIIIRALHIASLAGIDIEDAVRRKLAGNRQRGRRHGGKTA